VKHIWCAPGNGGISQDAECVAADMKDVAGLAGLAARLGADLTVVGPELPLVLGIVDEFEKRGLRIVGPSQAAAQLEGSKVFAKEFLGRHGIPTAPLYGIYTTPGDAYSALCSVDWPVVIKADGLAAGKGVMVASTPDDATAFIDRLMEQREFGDSGDRVILEEALEGQELSYIVLTDGEHIVPMVPTRDHKRVFDGDQGPNTGGMGAYSTADLLPPALEKTIRETIVDPAVRGMAREGQPYKGFLYFGLMLTSSGPKVLEFNCRMGDPETQPIALRMDFDLAETLMAVAEGELAGVHVKWKPEASICVVLASGGYPGRFETGKAIQGLDKVASGVTVFHAGTKRDGGNYLTSGGRVLGVGGTGRTLEEAARLVYDSISSLSFDGLHFRKDIGKPRESSAVGG
jgi:phosphoribosylamine--glycine ligase